MADYLVAATRDLNEARSGTLDFEAVADGSTFYARKYAYPSATDPVYIVIKPGANNPIVDYQLSGVSNLTLVGVWADGDYVGVSFGTDLPAVANDLRVVLSYTGDVSGAAISDAVSLVLTAAYNLIDSTGALLVDADGDPMVALS